MEMDLNIYKYSSRSMAQRQRFISRILCLYIGKTFDPSSANTIRHAFQPPVYTTIYPKIPAAMGHRFSVPIAFAAPVKRGKSDVVLEE